MSRFAEKLPLRFAVGALARGLERREVEKRIYGEKDSGSRLPPPFMMKVYRRVLNGK